eukprot:TRINITY_DN6645_c0_g1_i1.p1 TRINITY_DN6645_c0_g1~~TRINITY_DN6645_c0_g1_i1.p1  ORF type:complete len:228 (-),score=44.63 TRINITY_DN6645_c0_g1_i1:18-701(-)
MEGPEFFKFPKTEHMAGSCVVDDDLSMEASQLMLVGAGKRLIIQEKVDGSNVSIHFNGPWDPVIQKRSGLLATKEKPQYDVFRNWCYENMEELYAILKEEYCLFGEWLWCKHGIEYDELPSYFSAFDIMRKSDGVFLSNAKVREMLKDSNICCVPNLYDGDIRRDLDNFIPSLIVKSKFGKEIAEGVYIRIEDEQKVLLRCKYRRKNFTPGRDTFDKIIENNQLKSN